jgi:hypothetical protein
VDAVLMIEPQSPGAFRVTMTDDGATDVEEMLNGLEAKVAASLYIEHYLADSDLDVTQWHDRYVRIAIPSWWPGWLRPRR